MPKTKTTPEVDGRRQRSERSRQAIIDAMAELILEGILVPTAQQVSDRANVGIRTVFRHFSDMETLFAMHDAQSRVDFEPLFIGGNRKGTLEERIVKAVKRRSHGFEHTWSVSLSTHAQSWRFEKLRNLYASYQRALRRDLESWLPELKSLSKSKIEAANAVASFEMWHRLREHQGLGNQAAINILVDLLRGLIVHADNPA